MYRLQTTDMKEVHRREKQAQMDLNAAGFVQRLSLIHI